MQKERLAYLLEKYMDDRCTPAEKEEFLKLASLSTGNDHLQELLEKAWKEHHSGERISEKASNRIFREIISWQEPPARERSNVFTLFRSRWMKYAAAIMIIAGAITFFYSRNPLPGAAPIAYNRPVPVQNDVLPPDSVHAFITTASGKRIVLDNKMKNGASGGNLRQMSDGNVSYYDRTSDRIEYHTLSVPRGSRAVSLILSDSSRVWLNVGSSLTYPTAFIGARRLVSITGEGYFEIAPNSKMPFIVQKDDAMIQVLGTHFNVNAYDDEDNIKVTLLTGSVKVSRAKRAVTLTAGQQATVMPAGDITLKNDADLEEVMAWKMERFVFNNADIKTIMRQIMKWYDVDVVYEGGFPDRYFTADISRNTNLSELLKVLELSKISFRLEGKKLIVAL